MRTAHFQRLVLAGQFNKAWEMLEQAARTSHNMSVPQCQTFVKALYLAMERKKLLKPVKIRSRSWDWRFEERPAYDTKPTVVRHYGTFRRPRKIERRSVRLPGLSVAHSCKMLSGVREEDIRLILDHRIGRMALAIGRYFANKEQVRREKKYKQIFARWKKERLAKIRKELLRIKKMTA